MFPLSDSIKTPTFPIVNIMLIFITVFVFIQQVLSPDPEGFIYSYALIPANLDFSDYRTLFTFLSSMFLHGDLIHIASNMWFLWVFGDNVEAYLGKFRYLFLYLASGIVGGLVQYFFSPNSPIPMLGASGAVAGALGAYYVLFPHAKIKSIVPIFFFVTFLEVPASIMLGWWFVIQLLSGAATLPFMESQQGGVAFWAHIGGFVTGIVLANILKRASPTPALQRYAYE